MQALYLSNMILQLLKKRCHGIYVIQLLKKRCHILKIAICSYYINIKYCNIKKYITYIYITLLCESVPVMSLFLNLEQRFFVQVTSYIFEIIFDINASIKVDFNNETQFNDRRRK